MELLKRMVFLYIFFPSALDEKKKKRHVRSAKSFYKSGRQCEMSGARSPTATNHKLLINTSSNLFSWHNKYRKNKILSWGMEFWAGGKSCTVIILNFLLAQARQ